MAAGTSKAAARPVIIDTDPGVDDAIAILLAFASPELEVLGLTAVAGNVPLALTEVNARRLCELAGRKNAKVFAGCARPRFRPLTCGSMHGATGLGGVDLPAPRMALQPRHAVDWIVDTVMAAPEGALTLCALGPLTNVATAFEREPRVARRLERVVVMGGGTRGNITPAAEFNMFVDPDAAAAVFESGAVLTLVPLDVTRQALMTEARLVALRALGTPVAHAAAAMIEGYGDVEGPGGKPLHDACVIAWLVDPGLFEGAFVHVAVETRSELTLGMTAIDWQGVTGRPPNCTVLTRIDAPRFFDLLLARLARL